MPVDWIIKYWAEWLFGSIAAALAAAYRSLSRRVKTREAESVAVKEGVLAILHDRLYAECSRCLAQGSIDTDGLLSLGKTALTALVKRCMDILDQRGHIPGWSM